MSGLRFACATLVRVMLFAVIPALPGPAAFANETAGTKLPYQAANRHLGVATCSSSVCHGNVKSSSSYNVQLNEYVTWSHDDAHSKAYSVLLNARSRSIAAKLGLPDAHTAKICLDCHADNVPEAQRGKGFNISDGVGCEACHGGAERWIEAHTMKKTTYADNLARGMYPTATLSARAPLCLSCHMGNADKYATHRIMGAGHPRLSFELDTFQALQPAHHQVDQDYAERKPTYTRTATWAYGQLEAARMQIQLVQRHFTREGSTFPELALFNCHACHQSSMRNLDWSRGVTTPGTQPGSVPLNDGHLRMSLLIARQISPGAARDLLALAQGIQEASGVSRERVSQLSGRIEATLRQLEDVAARHRWTAAEHAGLLAGIFELGTRREFRDYIAAEQAVMALELVLLDTGVAERHRARLDTLFRLVDNDEAYRPQEFAASLDQLRAALGIAPAARPASRP